MEFIQLMDHYDLFNRTIAALYRLPPEIAVEAAQELVMSDSQSQERFYPAYLRICMSITNDDHFGRALDFLDDRLYLKDKSVLAEVLLILQDAFSRHTAYSIATRRQTKLLKIAEAALSPAGAERCSFHNISRHLLSIIDHINRERIALHDVAETKPISWIAKRKSDQFNQIPCKKRRTVKLSVEAPFATEDMKSSWMSLARKRCTKGEDSHKHAFLLICERLQNRAHPLQSLVLREHLCHSFPENDSSSLIYDGMINNLNLALDSGDPHESSLIYCKIWCLRILRDRGSGWKSVLRVMVQFADLWIFEMTQKNTLPTFATLVSCQKLEVELYSTISKLVRLYHEHGEKTINPKTIKDMCLLFSLSLDQLADIKELFALRNYVFHSSSTDDISNPTFASLEFWPVDFYADLTKVLNQIVSGESQNAGRVEKEQQYATIRKLVKPENSELIQANTVNITSFLTSCCEVETLEEYPTILLPERSVQSSPSTILDASSYLEECVLPYLDSIYDPMEEGESNIEVFRLSLQTLGAFCEVKSPRFKNWLTLIKHLYEGQACSIGVPVVLKANPFGFARCLSKIMDLRNANRQLPQGIRLQDWELVQLYCKKLSCILGNGLHTLKAWTEGGNEDIMRTRDAYHLEMKNFFEEIKIYDWKTQLLWCDLQLVAWPFLDIDQQLQIQVPGSLYSITGSLHKLLVAIEPAETVAPEDEKMVGWVALFEGCKASRALTRELFKHKDNWMYNLLLLWKHPNEDEIVSHCLQQVLHPALSLSVHDEYNCLLIDFLAKLFQSFNGAQVVRDYSYPIREMCQFTARLTDTGCKLFFTVLYVMKLFSRQKQQSLDKVEPSGSMVESNYQGQEVYYVSGLIKVLQSLYPWSNPRRPGCAPKQPVSLKRIREALMRDNVMEENIVKANCQENVSSGATEDQNQAPMTDNEISPKIMDVHYPFLDKEAISNRSLSVLTLCMLCYASYQLKDAESRDMIRVLSLQIVEGLRDNEGQQEFQRAISLQTKSTVNHWRKIKEAKKRIVLRPPLSLEEERLVRSYVMLLKDPEENRGIFQALGMSGASTAEKEKVKKKEAIYVV
ncbi:hypothetical protein DFQ30_007276 [Apophysomyces sp. BC1015]|nr:hypothetical protein DFQ30_007276 [Apophysomyces sp. BC1015]